MSVVAKASPVAKVAPAIGIVAFALGIVYVVWGSTYLAIRVVVQEAPPLTSMGIRYVAGSILLGGILATRGGLRRLALTRKQALGAAFLGLMLPVMGNGMVSVGENLGAPSGATALLIAVTPLMIVLFRSLEGDRPPRTTMIGVLLGFAGLAYLVLAGRGGDGRELPVGAALVIVGAATCWAFGSYRQGRLWLPRDVFVTTVYEMLFGGLMLLVMGRATGESFTGDYSPRIWVALAYLIVFGSVIGFTAYVWLVSSAPISLVSTYAYVNPVVAVFLGWLILSERVTAAVLVGGGIVVLAVALVITSERPRKKPLPDPPSPDDAAHAEI
jgi:drug/metabolite transporter (DMT)-like permease